MSFISASALRRAALATLVVAAVPPAASAPAEARAGGGFSFGSRGSRTFSAPPPTATAPRYAQPFNGGATPSFGPTATQPRRFGFGTGLLAGLLGAGLMGSLFGAGFLGGIAAFVGLLFKLALLGGLILLVLRLVRGRRAAPAGTGPGFAARFRTGGPLPGGAPARPAGVPLAVGPDDYRAFEAALLAVQQAFSREDAAALDRLATPDMARGLVADGQANARRGLRNDVSGVRLISGDLSEAWREGAVDYATVAMRFAAIDVMVDRASGRLVSGDAATPVEATELWTFRRNNGGAWRLSAIQQAG